jgi:hypothetical protein
VHYFPSSKFELNRALDDVAGRGTPTPGVAEATPTPQPDSTSTEEKPESGGNEGGEGGEPQQTQTEAKPAPKSQKDWRDARIGEVSAKNRLLEKQLQEQQAEIARFRAAQTTQQTQQGQTPSPQMPQAEIERLAKVEAARMQFDASCNRIAGAGKSEFSDWDSKINEFAGIGGLPPSVIEAALEMEEDGDGARAHTILYALANDLDEAMRIKNLSPSRMGAALAKLASSGPKRQPSSAPEPPGRNLRGPSAAPVGDPDKMTMKEWIAWREKTAQPRRR